MLCCAMSCCVTRSAFESSDALLLLLHLVGNQVALLWVRWDMLLSRGVRWHVLQEIRAQAAAGGVMAWDIDMN